LEFTLEMIIFITGALSIWLLARDEGWSRWGFIVGIIGQPCWVYTTISNGQWGLFFLTLFYTYSFAMGIYNKFIKRNGRKTIK